MTKRLKYREHKDKFTTNQNLLQSKATKTLLIWKDAYHMKRVDFNVTIFRGIRAISSGFVGIVWNINVHWNIGWHKHTPSAI